MRHRTFLAVLLLGLALACGGGTGTGVTRGSGATGNVAVQMGSDSFPGYDQVVVSVEKVDASADGSTWVPVGTVQGTYDLMALQNGHPALMLPAAPLAAGAYTHFRITWAAQNYRDGARPPAYAYPSGAATGQTLAMPATTVLPGSVTVAASGTQTLQLMLSGQQAVQVRAGTAPYAFQATGQAFDLARTATVAGQLLDGATALAGAEVYAETLDGTLTAAIQRRAFTDAGGRFALECLPTSALYVVVAQPTTAAGAYGAEASEPISATTAATYPANLSFSGPQAPGNLTLTITPASTASQGTWGELRQTLATGASSFQTLIVRSQTATTGLVQDQVYFTGLAPGSYGVAAQRSTSGGAPILKAAGSLVPVGSGATATATVGYP